MNERDNNLNVLFVCLANLQRSPTAEDMIEKRAADDINVKSAGVYSSAVTKINHELLDWADNIYVMTKGIKDRIESEYPNWASEKDIKVLGIKDLYRRGETRLKCWRKF
ncbi:hypothetical protein AKJ51_04580 [candidate division MSBL1 archaeon SCGC-AAA382A20]|uniref:Phosphotyrosine protein phosphatase I domain-containing protein n=1 Tax=candidate division MSBL1 archaeon SCGC-AAA382A20 TaxID=1698280 RepID=A0A133VHH6_9EURY|nr:hypothetical protein AKJ51_04580 [candidate division MSBL1 archaeon SCGC-AAA382A20]